jgi:hypothetical protein
MKLTGTEFIFTPYARGLEVELQEKLEELVDGRGMLQARTQRRIKWKNIGALIDDLDSGGGGGSVLGPVARDVIKTRLAEASLGLRPSLKPKQILKSPASLIQITSSATPGKKSKDRSSDPCAPLTRAREAQSHGSRNDDLAFPQHQVLARLDGGQRECSRAASHCGEDQDA